LTSVDKANVLSTSRLWRRIVDEVALHYPDVALDHLYVDAAAMALVAHPSRFDVVLTENMFGDILSDELAVICGKIGLLGSASLGARGPGLFEPIHGSAPDIAGLDIANPAGAIAAAAMLLDHGLGLPDMAHMLDEAVSLTLRGGVRTADLGGSAGCAEFGARVREHLDARLGKRDALLELIAMNRGCCG
jgi:3-isopropylmalate dehydrogenase